jgi:PTH1 family peptidyl-tRNA hydrolase
MKIVVGLGNPGMKYAGTRHNVGFSVILELGDRYGIKVDTKKHKALIGKGIVDGEKIILAMPQTYMNLSGESVREIVDFYKCSPEDLIVVYDDIDLDVGKLRVRQKGSAGGHNGMKNIVQHLGSTTFDRVRVGVGKKPDNMDLADYVLSRFGKGEIDDIRESCMRAAEAVDTIIKDGAVAAMNKFN